MITEYFHTPKELGKYFLQLRRERKISHKALARATGYPHLYISSVLRGLVRKPGTRPIKGRPAHPDKGIWQCLCDVFGVSYQELLEHSYLNKSNNVPQPDDEASQADGQRLSLDELLRGLQDMGVYNHCPSRVGPTRTYLGKFARANGYASLADCPAALLNSPLKTTYVLIETHFPMLGDTAIRNFKNNISFLVRHAEAKSLLSGRSLQPISEQRAKQTGTPPTNHSLHLPSYRLTAKELSQIPSFVKELKDYSAFSMNVARTPRSIRKRRVSMSAHLKRLIGYAGYLVHHLNVPLSDICLARLVRKEEIQSYVEWTLERNIEKYADGNGNKVENFSGITADTPLRVIALQTLAKYYLKDTMATADLKDIANRVKDVARIKDKESLLVSLRDIERVGLSLYPFKDNQTTDDISVLTMYARARVFRYLKAHGEFQTEHKNGRTCYLGRKLAQRVGLSVIFRLLVQLPLRQRNIREMKLGRNLYREGVIGVN